MYQFYIYTFKNVAYIIYLNYYYIYIYKIPQRIDIDF